MEDGNIINAVNNGHRVSSTYAEIYFENKDDTLSSEEKCTIIPDHYKHLPKSLTTEFDWTSPSDLLIGKVQLKPPLTSKITQSKTHKGILAIGNLVLDNERIHFLTSLKNILRNNDATWDCILKHEKQEIIKKVKVIFQNIFKRKSEIMKKDIMNFFEQSLGELDKYMKTELQVILQTAYSGTVSDLNNQIHFKLQKERNKLEIILQKEYITKLEKVKKYYTLLLNNELFRNSKLIHDAIQQRNEALNAFYKQIEAERNITTMYTMINERKKCRVQKIILEKIQTAEIMDKINKIKEQAEGIETMRKDFITMSEINQKWENNIKNIYNLFLKFIAYSLKLLPEQATFLLDLEKMVKLQLEEMKKSHNIASSILINNDTEANDLHFENSERKNLPCDVEPFILYGDMSDLIMPRYGSRETLPSDVELPYIRLQRQFMYAKCHGFESIKKILESQVCQCRVNKQPAQEQNSSTEEKSEHHASTISEESSFESLLLDDIQRLHECPLNKCGGHWIERNSFPLLTSYLDYTEENYNRVTAILGKTTEIEILPELINAKQIVYMELPFAATKELHKTVGTQYSSNEDLTSTQSSCICFRNIVPKLQISSSNKMLDTQNIKIKRRGSLETLIREQPNILKLFTDECFDCNL